jgi:ATP-binding cassette subfamily B protein
MERSKSGSRKELWSIFRRARNLWSLIPIRQRWTLSLAVVLMALGGASNTAIPLLLGRLVDSVRGSTGAARTEGPRSLFETVALSLCMIGGAYLIREILQVGRRVLVEDTCTRLEKHLFVRLVSHCLMTDRSALSQEKIGTLHGRMLRNVTGSVRFLRVGFLDFLPALLAGTMALSAVVVKQPWLGLVTLGVIPISTYLTIRQLMSQKGVRVQLLRCREEMDGTVVEQLGGIDYIRAANTHRHETARVARAAESLRKKELRHHLVMSLYGSGKALIEGLFHVLVLGVAVYFAAVGRISIGEILTFSMLFVSVMAPLAEVHRMIDEGHESSLLVAELLQMLREPVDPCYHNTVNRQAVLNDGVPVIRVENLAVDYALPQGGRRRAIEGVSLAIQRGEIIGIAGKSGCGKTTFLRALMRLVHLSDGHAELGGAPLESLACDSFARILGYVGQSPFVFSSTVGENIAYEREGASLEEIRHAAQTACLDDEIMQIPGGFDSLITERGQNLSGGQRQRLALARVILKNPPILILDEATSALDTISEGRIQQWLASARGRQTVILVAHRLSTLLHTDRILVFDEGRIVESGTYDELVERGGIFTDLVRSAGHSATELVTQSA